MFYLKQIDTDKRGVEATNPMEKTMKAIKITADGNVDQIEVNGYEDLKEHIGGWLEGLHLTDDTFAYIDEEGKMKGLPYNVLATELCTDLQVGLAPTDFISGTMLIVGSPDSEGNETDVPDHILPKVINAEES